MDEPKNPEYETLPEATETEGVRILGAQSVGAPALSVDDRPGAVAPRSSSVTPSWDDEDDEEWDDEWAADDEVHANHHGDSHHGGDHGGDEWETADESGVWGVDETGSLRAPAAHSAEGEGSARWRSGADDWADDGHLDALDDDAVRVGTLDPDRGEESDLYRFRELDDPADDAHAEPLVNQARKASTGDGLGGRPVSSRQDRPRPSVAAPPSPLPAGLGSRVITAAGLIAVFALVVGVFHRKGATALVAAVLLSASVEFFTALRHRGFAPAIIPGALACFALPLAAYASGEEGMFVVLVLTSMVTLLWSLFRVVRDRPVGNMSVTFLNVGYIGVLGGTAGLILHHPNGLGLLLGGVACTVASDVVGFFVGANLGKIPLAPEISPNKTLEGFVGGLFGSILVGTIGFGLIGVAPWNVNGWGMGLILGIVVGVLAPLGDLVESMIKRDLGIKDMGAILPGHGGVLDRVDAMLFVMPGIYFIARLKNWIF